MWAAANCESELELLTQYIILRPSSLLKPTQPSHMVGLLLLLTIILFLVMNVIWFSFIFEQHDFTGFRETELDLQMVELH